MTHPRAPLACRWQGVDGETGRVERSAAHRTADGEQTLCGLAVPRVWWRAEAWEVVKFGCRECGIDRTAR